MDRLGGDSPTPHPAREGRDSLLADDSPEQAEADRRVVEVWEKVNGAPDIKGSADTVRARLLDTR